VVEKDLGPQSHVRWVKYPVSCSKKSKCFCVQIKHIIAALRTLPALPFFIQSFG
jgi:hypothetical protein